MKQNIEYTNNDLHIMPGFYESILFNSDTEYEENEQIRRDCEDNVEEFVEHEIKDFNEFQKAVCSRIVENLIKPLLCEDGEFNCHVDGCDYYRDSFEECLKLGMEIYNYRNEEYKIKNVPFSSDKYKYDMDQWSKELIKY